MQSKNALARWLVTNYLKPYSHFLIGAMSLASPCSIGTFMVGVQMSNTKWPHPSKSLAEELDWLASPTSMRWAF